MTGKRPPPAESNTKIGAANASDQRPDDAKLPSCGDFDIRIAADGTWFYRESPIGRPALVKLFSTVLRRDESGEYWLVTPAERGRVIVEDVPFTAVEMRIDGDGRAQVVSFRTNVDRWVAAGPEHPIRVETAPERGEPRPYVTVWDGLEALILRPVFYHLVEAAVRHRCDGQDVVGVWSGGVFFTLGPAE